MQSSPAAAGNTAEHFGCSLFAAACTQQQSTEKKRRTAAVLCQRRHTLPPTSIIFGAIQTELYRPWMQRLEAKTASDSEDKDSGRH